jgi:hypothetical protein
MGRSVGASFEIATGNLVEELNGVPFEFFNGVKKSMMLSIFIHKIYILQNIIKFNTFFFDIFW